MPRIPASRIQPYAAAAIALALLTACTDDDSVTAEPASATVPAASATSSASAAPGSNGATQPVGDGTAGTYVLSDSAGKPLEVGIRMSGSSLSGLPTESHDHPMPVILTFPTGAKSGVLNHVELYWNPTGHEPPGVWDKPHFDFHFYLTDEAAVREIDPAKPDFATQSKNLPDAKYMPADFVTPPGDPVVNTIPGMGLHWVDKTIPLAPGQYQFTSIMINGSYDGKYTFIEPMITRDWLLTHPTLDEPIKAPQSYQVGGLYPSMYKVRYDAAKDEYTIALSDFVERTAS